MYREFVLLFNLFNENLSPYLLGMGTEADIHTPHWHCNTLASAGHSTDVAELFPAATAVFDMTPDNAGIWMFNRHALPPSRLPS